VVHGFHDPRHVAETDMIRELSRTAAFESTASRSLLRELLAERLGGRLRLRQQDDPHLQCVELVRACLRTPGGLSGLAAVLDELAEPHAALAALLCGAEFTALAALDSEIPPNDWFMLREALRDKPLPDAAHLARAASGDRSPSLPAYCRTAWHTFVTLAGHNATGDGVPPWMVFLAVVADRLDQAYAGLVRGWTSTLARGWGLAGPLANHASRASLEAEHRYAKNPTAYLMIQLEPREADPSRILVSSWRQWDVGRWCPERCPDVDVPAEEVPRAVERLVEEMETHWRDRPLSRDRRMRAHTLTLEFILPDDLLDLPVESWHKESSSFEPVELGLEYPVVVRSLRRLRTTRWHRAWHDRWDLLVGAPGTNGPPRAHVSEWAEDGHFRRLTAALTHEQAVCLVLSSPPHATGTTGLREVELAMRAGCPAVLWSRVDCSSAEFREAIDRLLADGDFTSLPMRVREARRSCDDGQAGNRLALLWDDPWRIPEIPDI
jgi:hypothetical protein